MEKKVTVLSIMIENIASAEEVNRILHESWEYIIGRMGIPYREKGINVICIVMDAPADTVNSVSGKIGKLNGVAAKTITSK